MKTEITKFNLRPLQYLSGLKSMIYTQALIECALHGQMVPFLQLIELSKRKAKAQNIVEEQGQVELNKFLRIIQN